MQVQSEKRLYALLVLVVVGFLLVNSIMAYAVLTGAPKVISIEPDEKEANIIVVSGTGTVTATPDRAYVTFAVWSEAATATQAQTSNAEKMNQMIKALTDAGVSMDAMKTIGYSLEPVFYYPEKSAEPPRIVGYIVRNEIEVKLTDVASVGRIIDLAVAGGANLVTGVYFTLSDGKAAELRDEAIQEAVKDADSKAKAIAESMNVKIIGPVSVTLGYEYPVPKVFYERMAAAQPTPIIPSPVTVTANVQATYSFS